MNIVEKKPRPRKAATASPAQPPAKLPPNVRRLKISSHHYLSKSRSIGNHNSSSIVPYLRLCGDWLQAAGFSIGQYVNITVSENKLIIEQEN